MPTGLQKMLNNPSIEGLGSNGYLDIDFTETEI